MYQSSNSSDTGQESSLSGRRSAMVVLIWALGWVIANSISSIAWAAGIFSGAQPIEGAENQVLSSLVVMLIPVLIIAAAGSLALHISGRWGEVWSWALATICGGLIGIVLSTLITNIWGYTGVSSAGSSQDVMSGSRWLLAFLQSLPVGIVTWAPISIAQWALAIRGRYPAGRRGSRWILLFTAVTLLESGIDSIVVFLYMKSLYGLGWLGFIGMALSPLALSLAALVSSLISGVAIGLALARLAASATPPRGAIRFANLDAGPQTTTAGPGTNIVRRSTLRRRGIVWLVIAVVTAALLGAIAGNVTSEVSSANVPVDARVMAISEDGTMLAATDPFFQKETRRTDMIDVDLYRTDDLVLVDTSLVDISPILSESPTQPQPPTWYRLFVLANGWQETHVADIAAAFPDRTVHNEFSTFGDSSVGSGQPIAMDYWAGDPATRKVVLATDDGVVRLWGLPPRPWQLPTEDENASGDPIITNGLIGEVAGMPGFVRAVALSPDGTRVAQGDRDGKVTVWNGDARYAPNPAPGSTLTLEPASISSASDASYVHSVRFSHDGRLAAADGPGGIITVWDAESGLVVDVLGGLTPQSTVSQIAFSHLGGYLAAGLDDGSVWLWALDPTGRDNHPVSRQILSPASTEGQSPVTVLSFDGPDAKVLAAGPVGQVRKAPVQRQVSPP